MKKIIYSLLALVALASCSKRDETTTSFTTDGEVRINSSIATRTIGDTWEGGDEIGVYMTTTDGVTFADLGENVLYATTTTNGDFTSTSPLYFPAEGSVDLLAYYPHSGATTAAGVYSVDVTDQTDQGAIDLMSVSVKGQAKTENAVKMIFAHKLSRIEVLLKAGNGLTEDELLGVSVMLSGTDAEATFDLTTDAVTLGDNIAEIAFESTDVDDTYQAIVIPQELSEATLHFITTNYGTFSASISTAAFTVGNEYIYTATLNATSVDLSSATISSWGEGDEGDDKLDAELFIPDIELVDGTYLINTAAGLWEFAAMVDDGNTEINVTLVNNIDLKSVEWTPIGTSDKPFSGTFDGDGYTISGLCINATSEYVGVFGYVDGGNISNLIVNEPEVTGGIHTGAVCGYITSGSVESCGVVGGSVSGPSSEKSGTLRLGGVVGIADYSSVTKCYNTGCAVSGTAFGIWGSAYVGGVVGQVYCSPVTSCYNTGDVSGTSSYYITDVGGVVGLAYDSVTSCYNTGAVSGTALASSSNSKAYVGGVMGSAYFPVTSCYNTGEVNGTAGSNLNYVGGMVGKNYYTTFTRCYYDYETSKVDIGDGDGSDTATGLTTVLMKGNAETEGTLLYYLTDLSQGNSSAWLADTSGINNGYPILSWQVAADND